MLRLSNQPQNELWYDEISKVREIRDTEHISPSYYVLYIVLQPWVGVSVLSFISYWLSHAESDKF